MLPNHVPGPSQVPLDSRLVARRRIALRLPAGEGVRAAEVTLLDLSETGFRAILIESLDEGEMIEIVLPEAGAVSARLLWLEGDVGGFAFESPITTAAVSASRLRSPFAQKGGSTAEVHARPPLFEPDAGIAKLPRNMRVATIFGINLALWAGLLAGVARIA